MRGGFRQGSGRKPGRVQKRTVSFRFAPETIAIIRELRDKGHDVTAIVEDYILDFDKSCK